MRHAAIAGPALATTTAVAVRGEWVGRRFPDRGSRVAADQGPGAATSDLRS
jgi:hypothetical protein